MGGLPRASWQGLRGASHVLAPGVGARPELWYPCAMRAVVQRVSRASVSVDTQVVGHIDAGLCALVGVAEDDTDEDARALAHKLSRLRIFGDAEAKMNLDVTQVGGSLLAISQFTLLGDVRRGHRPSFSQAMPPERANQLFELFCQTARAKGLRVETGRFRASMQVSLVNEGPVTILLDTKKLF